MVGETFKIAYDEERGETSPATERQWRREKRLEKTAQGTGIQSSSQVAPRLTVSCTASVCPPGMARGKTTQSCRVTGEKMKFIKYPLRLSKKEDSKCSNTSVSSIPTSPLVKEVMNGSHSVITQTYSNSPNGCHSPTQSRKTTDGRPLSALSATSNPSSTSRHSPNPC